MSKNKDLQGCNQKPIKTLASLKAEAKVIGFENKLEENNEIIVKSFKESMQKLYQKRGLLNKVYNRCKKKLEILNRELDIYDNTQKNIQDEEKYKLLSNLDQTFCLIDDIFDKYRQSNQNQIYTAEQNKKIEDLLSYFKKIEDFNWIEIIIFSLPC